MHNPESIRENGTHTILWDFKIQANHLISARQPNLVVVNKNKPADFVVPADHRVKPKKSKKIGKYLDLAKERENNCGTGKWWWYQL